MKEEKILISKKPINKKILDKSFCDQIFCTRPKSLDEFIGQEKIIKQILVLIDFSMKNNTPLPHMLFYGEPGTGKTSLANILGNEVFSDTVVLSCPSIDKISKIVGVLMNIGSNQILFLDEIHALSRPTEEVLYSVMEDFVIDLIIDNNNQKKASQFPIPKFTLIGATTRLSKITKPLLSRFGLIMHFLPYSVEDLCKIIFINSKCISIDISGDAILEIATRSRSSPRQAKHILNWIKSYASANDFSFVDREIVNSALSLLGIDSFGLNETDIKFLDVLTNSQNQAVGLSTLSAIIGEESSTIEEIYEPYLIRLGMMKRTPSGRLATKKAYDHLMKKCPKKMN